MYMYRNVFPLFMNGLLRARSRAKALATMRPDMHTRCPNLVFSLGIPYSRSGCSVAILGTSSSHHLQKSVVHCRSCLGFGP